MAKLSTLFNCRRKNEKGETDKLFSTVRHARGNLDLILEIALRNITLKNIITKNTLIILCNLNLIIKSPDEFIFTFLSSKTVG